jgi:hypothetical protein
VSYLKPGAGSVTVDPETITLLCRLVGLTIPSEDIEPLAAAFQSQLAAIELLEGMELGDVTPSYTFDPRW